MNEPAHRYDTTQVSHALPLADLTIPDYLLWTQTAAADNIRSELVKSRIIAQAAESRDHSRIKGRLFLEITRELDDSGEPCEAYVDGPGVVTGPDTLRIPDVVVVCGDDRHSAGQIATNPILICEVISPSTRHTDKSHKFREYFKIASLRYYLILDPENRSAILHTRTRENQTNRTQPQVNVMDKLSQDDSVELALPPITVNLANVFARPDNNRPGTTRPDQAEGNDT